MDTVRVNELAAAWAAEWPEEARLHPVWAEPRLVESGMDRRSPWPEKTMDTALTRYVSLPRR